MKCTICGEPIVLVPSAAERAAKYGGKPSDYTKLFTEHARCTISKREADTIDLMCKKRKEREFALRYGYPLFDPFQDENAFKHCTQKKETNQ